MDHACAAVWGLSSAVAMEAWKDELDSALAQGLEDLNDSIEEQLLEDVFLNLDL